LGTVRTRCTNWLVGVSSRRNRSSRVPTGCGRLSAAYTQYRLEQVSIPFIIDGHQQILSLPTIISEHYNGKDPTTAIMLERFYFARYWGKVRWERWNKRRSPRAGLAQEYPTIPT
jgi:hypothetical protein